MSKNVLILVKIRIEICQNMDTLFGSAFWLYLCFIFNVQYLILVAWELDLRSSFKIYTVNGIKSYCLWSQKMTTKARRTQRKALRINSVKLCDLRASMVKTLNLYATIYTVLSIILSVTFMVKRRIVTIQALQSIEKQIFATDFADWN